jgi:hypothetical protein
MSNRGSNMNIYGAQQPPLPYGDRRSSRRSRNSPESGPPALTSPFPGFIERSVEPSINSIRPVASVPSGRLVVGQEALARYRELIEAQKQREAMRGSIVQQLEAGAAIEPGMLTAHLRRASQRRFSAEQLERLLGAEQVERLRVQLQPVVTVQLIVDVAPS